MKHVGDQVVLDHDPVAYCRRSQRVRIVSELGRDQCPQLARFSEHRERARSTRATRPGTASPANRLCERRLEGRAPAELDEGVPRGSGSAAGTSREVVDRSIRRGCRSRRRQECSDRRERGRIWHKSRLLGVGALGRGGLSSRTWWLNGLLLERVVIAGSRVTFGFHPGDLLSLEGPSIRIVTRSFCWRTAVVYRLSPGRAGRLCHRAPEFGREDRPG